MKDVDIKQIVLDVLTMYEDPDIGSLTEPDFEAFADEVDRRVNKNDSISDVIEITERLDNMRVEIERLKEFTGLDHL